MGSARVAGALVLGLLLGAAGMLLAGGGPEGWTVAGAGLRRARKLGPEAGASATARDPGDRSAAHGWRPGPIAFAEVGAALGLPAGGFAGEASWGDIDGDGDPDLFLAGGEARPSALFVNEGGRVFTDATERLRLAPDARYQLGVFCDFDADGDLDLYLVGAGTSPDRLLRQRGDGSFEDVTAQYGLTPPAADRSTDALWLDLDGDGRLDLFVARAGGPDLFYRREAGATFVESAAEAGLDGPSGGFRAHAFDLDRDGQPGLLLLGAPGGPPGRLLANRGGGSSFAERGLELGLEHLRNAIHAAAGDLDGDGAVSLFLLGANGEHFLFPGRSAPGLAASITRAALPFALPGRLHERVALADFDLDGALDLLLAGPDGLALLRNRGDGSFADETLAARLAGLGGGAGRTFALADFDLDGDVDVLVSGGVGPLLLLENRTRGGRRLRIAPRGLPGNPAGLGASFTVLLPDGRELLRSVAAGRDEPLVCVGLGPHEHALEVRAHWSDGGRTRVQGVPAGETLFLAQTGAPVYASSHPAALLGAVPAFDLDAALERAAALLGEKLPATDADAVHKRSAALLAWADARGIEPEPQLLDAALARIADETRLDRAARALTQRLRVKRSEIEERADRRLPSWSRQARVAGRALVFRDPAAARAALARAGRGRGEALALAVGLPAIADAAADAPAYGYPFTQDARAFAALGARAGAPFESPLLPEPGSHSPLFTLRGGACFLVVERVLPSEIPTPRDARERAEAELRRELTERSIDALLGLAGTAGTGDVRD